MQIVSRLSISADGYVTTPDGWPAQLAEPRLFVLASRREANRGGDVHLIGGHDGRNLPWPRRPGQTRTRRAAGLLGDGMRLTPALSPDSQLTFVSERALPGGSVKTV